MFMNASASGCTFQEVDSDLPARGFSLAKMRIGAAFSAKLSATVPSCSFPGTGVMSLLFLDAPPQSTACHPCLKFPSFSTSLS